MGSSPSDPACRREGAIPTISWKPILGSEATHGRIHKLKLDGYAQHLPRIERNAFIKDAIARAGQPRRRCGSRGALIAPGITLCLRLGARDAVHHGGFRGHDQARAAGHTVRFPGTPAYAAPCLRLRAGQCRVRHPGFAGVARSQGHPAHGAVHRAVSRSVQELLAIVR